MQTIKKICGTSAKIIQLNEWGCRDGMRKSWNRGNPFSTTIKDTIAQSCVTPPYIHSGKELRMIVL